MTDRLPPAMVHPNRYLVTVLPPGFPGGDMYAITVEERADGWGVFRGQYRSLGADGTWSWGYRWREGDREPATDAEWDDYHTGHEAWLAEHRFDKGTALRLAKEAAPHVTNGRRTAAQALADYQEREGAAP